MTARGRPLLLVQPPRPRRVRLSDVIGTEETRRLVEERQAELAATRRSPRPRRVTTPAFPVVLPEASGLSAFRELPDGSGRAYTVVEAPSGRVAVERIVRTARAVGFLLPPGSEGYAILDVWDDDGVIQDFVIPDARAFRWWYRRLGLRVAE